MRFHIFLTALLLCTFASGLVIPSRLALRETDLNVRSGILNEDAVQFAVREPFLGGIVSKIGGGLLSKVGGAVAKVGGKIASKVGGAVSKVAGKVVSKAKELGSKVADKFSKKYTVPAGGGKPAQTYSRKDVKKAVKDANTEHQRLKTPGLSNTQKKKSLLKPFNNNNHQVPKPGGPAKSLPKMKGSGHEYPLRNAGQGPATAKDKGPARVIMQENKKGKLKLKGVVAHDQSRPLPAPGASPAPGTHDHLKVCDPLG